MSITIAVSGKGGTGKTTLAALIVRCLTESRNGSVLAVDADPNACLGITLGAEVNGTVSSLREQAKSKDPSPGGMDRVMSFEYGLESIISEQKGYDLISMGSPEGPSCYCAANNLLRKFLDKLTGRYNFVVIDNEAGMEHLSRRTTNDVDYLLVVAEQTPVGIITAQRICKLVNGLPITVKQKAIVWNRTENSPRLDEIENLGFVPYDPSILKCSEGGETIFDVASDSPACIAVQKLIGQIIP